MSIDPSDFRAALGCFATGVAIVTARASDGERVGITINSLSSVSLEPPLVLFCLGKQSQWLEALRDAGHFVVNVLAEDQRTLSQRFAVSSPDRWEGVETETWKTGAPVLRGCLAGIECETMTIHEGGDHLIMVGRVVRLASTRSGKPLIYFRGRYEQLP